MKNFYSCEKNRGGKKISENRGRCENLICVTSIILEREELGMTSESEGLGLGNKKSLTLIWNQGSLRMNLMTHLPMLLTVDNKVNIIPILKEFII